MTTQVFHTDDSLPNFSLTPSELEHEILTRLADHRSLIEQKFMLSDSTSDETDLHHVTLNDDLLELFETLDLNLNTHLNILLHLMSVRGTEQYFQYFNKIIPLYLNTQKQFFQNEKLYQIYLNFRKKQNVKNVGEKIKVIDNKLSLFRANGILLQPSQREKLNYYQERLVQLGNIFQGNIDADYNSTFVLVTDKSLLEGLPKRFVQSAKEKAKLMKKSGFVITLEPSNYDNFMRHAESRELRKQCYLAQQKLASPDSDNINHNNHPTMLEILEIRQKIAELFHCNNFADYTMQNRVLCTSEKARCFLDQLTTPFKEMARKEITRLKSSASQIFQTDNIQPWDLLYLQNKVFNDDFKEGKNQSVLFPLSKVYEATFMLIQELFSIYIEEVFDFDSWHPDVRLFSIFDQQFKLIGQFYVDLFFRKEKNQGAWCVELKTRCHLKLCTQTPIACIVANLERIQAIDGERISHEGIVIFLHEFGHCLHKLLSKVNYPSISGDNGIPLDASEIVSQFMEHWAYQEFFIRKILATDQNLQQVEKVIKNIQQMRNNQIGVLTIQTIELALFDLAIHTRNNAENILQFNAILNKISDEIGVFPRSGFNRNPYIFSHLFSNSFAAGYYSYLYCDVLSTEVFMQFENNGLFCPKVANRFLETFLQSGSSRDILKLFYEFTGRMPNVESFFQYHHSKNIMQAIPNLQKNPYFSTNEIQKMELESVLE